MELLSIFVSSTCQDLKFVRESIGSYIYELGHRPIMCEKNIYYKQYFSPEQSCYDDIDKSDILVHIIGENFGSTSNIKSNISVAEAELITALELRKPVFIFLYNPVLHDYQIYKKNENRQISFSTVKDSRIFSFIDYIYASNLPVFQYECVDDIKRILRNQLSYLFSSKLRETICTKGFSFDQNYVNISKEFIEDFRNCNSLSVFGLGQNRMVKSYYGLIKQSVVSGKCIRYILADPNGEGARMCARFSALCNSISDDMAMHKSAINMLMDIKNLNPEYLKVKVVDIFPPFTMYAFNIEAIEHSNMYIWFTPIYLPALDRLGFKITGKKEPEMCKKFIDQFNMLYSAPDSREIVNKYQ